MPPRRDCINAFTRCLSTAAGFYGGTLGCCWAGPGCWARLFLAGRLTGCITFVLKRYSYTPLFVSEFSFSSLKLKNQFPNEVRVPKIYFIRRCIQNEWFENNSARAYNRQEKIAGGDRCVKLYVRPHIRCVKNVYVCLSRI